MFGQVRALLTKAAGRHVARQFWHHLRELELRAVVDRQWQRRHSVQAAVTFDRRVFLGLHLRSVVTGLTAAE